LKISSLHDFYGIFDAESGSVSVIYYEECDSVLQSIDSSFPDFLQSNQEIYKNLLNFLTKVFYNDKLAAKYFIFSMCSSVYARADPLPLGRLSVNFGNLPCKEFAKDFTFYVLRKILPCCKYLELTLEGLNDDEGFNCPKKNFDFDDCEYDFEGQAGQVESGQENLDNDPKISLNPGYFQATNGTAYIFTDSYLQAGKLEHQGVNSLKTLRNLIQWQTLNYDFKFYNQDFHVDYRFCQFSDSSVKTKSADANNQKNFLIFDTGINLKFDDDSETQKNFDPIINFTQVISQEPENTLPTFQFFIEKTRLAAKTCKLSTKENKTIEDYWVKNRPELNTDDLHRLLTMGRIYKCLVGEEQYDFGEVVKMEEERRGR